MTASKPNINGLEKMLPRDEMLKPEAPNDNVVFGGPVIAVVIVLPREAIDAKVEALPALVVPPADGVVNASPPFSLECPANPT
jgi:hypothetical protein